MPIPCNLCPGGEIRHPLHVLENGISCAELMVEIANFPNALCQKTISKYNEICCGINKPPPSPTPNSSCPNEQPPLPQKDGPHDRCNLCRSVSQPPDPSMVLNMLYIGVGTCRQYWIYGQRGLIPNYLCSTLQYFAHNPCGCNELELN